MTVIFDCWLWNVLSCFSAVLTQCVFVSHVLMILRPCRWTWSMTSSVYWCEWLVVWWIVCWEVSLQILVWYVSFYRDDCDAGWECLASFGLRLAGIWLVRIIFRWRKGETYIVPISAADIDFLAILQRWIILCCFDVTINMQLASTTAWSFQKRKDGRL